MTDSTSPAPLQRVPVVCVKCGATAEIWISAEELSAMEFTYSQLDAAYLHVCGKCLYQTADDISRQPRSHDPERAAHHQRTSGAYHTPEWRMR